MDNLELRTPLWIEIARATCAPFSSMTAGVLSKWVDEATMPCVAWDRQTQTLMQVLKGSKAQPSVVKATPTFKWPILGDDGPGAKEVEEFL
eukprot:2317590-Alexandrium_andersonii.AAC.1